MGLGAVLRHDVLEINRTFGIQTLPGPKTLMISQSMSGLLTLCTDRLRLMFPHRAEFGSSPFASSAPSPLYSRL